MNYSQISISLQIWEFCVWSFLLIFGPNNGFGFVGENYKIILENRYVISKTMTI